MTGRLLITSDESTSCCMRGKQHSIEYTLTCTNKERIPCPDWKNITFLDFKPGFRAFANMEVYTGIEEFLCNLQEHKHFHIDFFEKFGSQVFYKTTEWQCLIRMLDTHKIVGNIDLEIVVQFTKGQDINNVSSYNFIVKCWNIIQNNINFEKFSIISYIHSLEWHWLQKEYIIKFEDGITYGPQVFSSRGLE